VIHRPGRRSPIVVALLLAVASTTGCTGDDGAAAPTTTTSPPEPSIPDESPACDGEQRDAPVEQIDVVVDGTPRTARVHVPATDGAPPLPVVVSFHGLSGSAGLQRTTDGLVEKGEQEGFVAVHPEGLLVGLNDAVIGTAGWDPDGNEANEPAFVTAVLDRLGEQVCIDPARVYATGFSAGAYNALIVACALPDRIAAIALVSAAYQSTACSSGRAMPTLALHGLDDIITPFDGRSTEAAGTFVGVLDVLHAQAARNGCAEEPESAAVTPTVGSLTWSGCAEPTVLYRLDDHGHAWPGHPLPFTADVLANVLGGAGGQPPDPLMIALGATPDAMARNVLLTNVEIDATDLLWEFFASVR
jgi:polyhydroxybutyrate depolymerase